MEIKIINYEDVKHITSKEYFNGNEMAIDVFDNKYVYDEETPADVFWRVALGLAEMEVDPKDIAHYASVWFSLMWEGWFRPGGSVIAGVGSPKKKSLLNCTTIPLNDDSLEGIIGDTELWMAKCAANRQGLGVDLSNLRPDRAVVNNAAEESTGSIPWGTKLSNIGEVVGQRGRMPASLLSLKIHHPDIKSFILSKSELGVISNSNISVQITDEFMTAVENDEEFELYFQLDSSLSKERISSMVNARELFELIAKTANETAEPGVQFIDQMKAGTMSQCIFNVTGDKRFEIISTNACCFPDSVNITTNKGKMTLGEIKEYFKHNDLKILSKNLKTNELEYKDLENVHIRDNGKLNQLIELEIELENGIISKIECTPDHKIYTDNRGWIEANSLTFDDVISESHLH